MRSPGAGAWRLACLYLGRSSETAVPSGHPQLVTVDVSVKVGLKVVMARHFMTLAALLMQTNPQPSVLHVHVLDLHGERCADPRELIDHEADQRAVAKANGLRHVDRV